MIRVFAQMRFKEKIIDEVVVLKKAPYIAEHDKVYSLLDLITWLFLIRFLTFLYESYRAWKMQAIDTKHIKIDQFV